MILVHGYKGNIDALPGNIKGLYKVENDIIKFKMALKSNGGRPTCTKIYIIKSNLDNFTINDKIVDKIFTFEDDENLIDIIKNGYDTASYNFLNDSVESKSEESEVKVTEPKVEDISVNESGVEDIPVNESEESITETDALGDSVEEVTQNPIVESEDEVISETISESESVSEDTFEDSNSDFMEGIDSVEGTDTEGDADTAEPISAEDSATEDTFEDFSKQEADSVDSEDFSTDSKAKDFSELLEDEPLLDLDTTLGDIQAGSEVKVEETVDDVVDVEDSLDFNSIEGSVLETKTSIALREKEALLNAEQEQRLRDKQYIEKLAAEQKKQVAYIKNVCNKKLQEANVVIKNLSEKINKLEATKDPDGFLAFHKYAKNPRGGINEVFTKEELSELDNLKSTFSVVSTGTGFSTSNFASEFASSVVTNESKNPLYILDLSKDVTLSAIMKMVPKKGCSIASVLQGRDSLKSAGYSVKENVTYVPFQDYNDIFLLTLDWKTVLQNISEQCGSANVVIYLGELNSFSVKYVFQKLCSFSKVKGYVSVIANEIVLFNLIASLAFISCSKVITISNLIDTVTMHVKRLEAKNTVITSKGAIGWQNLIR